MSITLLFELFDNQYYVKINPASSPLFLHIVDGVRQRNVQRLRQV